MNGYCSCTQDTKERYWEQQFCQMQKGHESYDSEKEIYQTGCCTFRFSLFMSQNNETAAIVMYQTNPVEVEPFSYEKTFFCSNKIVWEKNALNG